MIRKLCKLLLWKIPSPAVTRDTATFPETFEPKPYLALWSVAFFILGWGVSVWGTLTQTPKSDRELAIHLAVITFWFTFVTFRFLRKSDNYSDENYGGIHHPSTAISLLYIIYAVILITFTLQMLDCLGYIDYQWWRK